ncbi:putative Ubiquitin carboxyl-terminal hydrolase [Blattamonas nauphoetae]|uniref:ubiquitinyl hydrolase 1 n=1 Tax=Blattamonas nauphoetae TaxID=2049346 RepID=A0ABQ9XHG7_9EUKA|nr:putative Ubiquitin carboxyl-terminal hydrolase [Blattamonas nauphoetae]
MADAEELFTFLLSQIDEELRCFLTGDTYNLYVERARELIEHAYISHFNEAESSDSTPPPSPSRQLTWGSNTETTDLFQIYFSRQFLGDARRSDLDTSKYPLSVQRAIQSNQLFCFDSESPSLTFHPFHPTRTFELLNPVQQTFNGVIAEEHQCGHCGHIQTRSDMSRVLNLHFKDDDKSLPSKKPLVGDLPPVQLESLLSDSFLPSQAEVKCERCSHMKGVSSTRLAVLPRVLVLSVNRFKFEDDRAKKIMIPVEIPSELNLSPYTRPDALTPTSSLPHPQLPGLISPAWVPGPSMADFMLDAVRDFSQDFLRTHTTDTNPTLFEGKVTTDEPNLTISLGQLVLYTHTLGFSSNSHAMDQSTSPDTQTRKLIEQLQKEDAEQAAIERACEATVGQAEIEANNDIITLFGEHFMTFMNGHHDYGMNPQRDLEFFEYLRRQTPFRERIDCVPELAARIELYTTYGAKWDSETPDISVVRTRSLSSISNPVNPNQTFMDVEKNNTGSSLSNRDRRAQDSQAEQPSFATHVTEIMGKLKMGLQGGSGTTRKMRLTDDDEDEDLFQSLLDTTGSHPSPHSSLPPISLPNESQHSGVGHPRKPDQAQFERFVITNKQLAFGVKEAKCNYSLRSIIVHKGDSTTTGHYVAYSEQPNSAQWMHYNDAMTQMMNREDVLTNPEVQKNCYLLERTALPQLSTLTLSIVCSSVVLVPDMVTIEGRAEESRRTEEENRDFLREMQTLLSQTTKEGVAIDVPLCIDHVVHVNEL